VRGVLKALIGVAGPILLVGLIVVGVSWSPRPPAAPASIDGPTGGRGGGVEMVGSPDGEWEVADGFLGYRITEQYPQLMGPSEAAGRTEEVEGRLLIADGTLAEVEIRGDLRELDSGHQNRDRAVQIRYLEAQQHPWASFELTEPLDLDGLVPGEEFEVLAAGTLEVREVRRDVDFPLEGRWDGDEVVIAGQLPTTLSSFGITPPDITGFVRVEDDAVIEVQLRFVRP
jgi:polyisoprenoid-binding protein YceI